jgi:cyclopropane fatty-acyl-phospholipid synthase-like methyltransferase
MKFHVITDYPVAIHSRDHTHPHGTINDNSRNQAFNEKLYKLYAGRHILLADMGCSGGGFVRDIIEAGHTAIGLEGSDFSFLSRRAEWATIPNNLFTCDITKPFSVVAANKNDDMFPVKFDVITGWELLEHIAEEDLKPMFANLLWHLKPDGRMIFSISKNPEFWHVCVHDESWWDDKFKTFGLHNRPDLVEYFGDNWVRGPSQGAPNSFHVVLERNS